MTSLVDQRALAQRIEQHQDFIVPTHLTLDVMRDLEARKHALTQEYLDGVLSKEHLLFASRLLGQALELPQRLLVFETFAIFQEACALQSFLPDCGASAAAERKKAATIIEQFQPLEDEPSPATLYGLYFLDDGCTVPYTLTCSKQRAGRAAYVARINQFPALLLYEQWSDETLKKYWHYLIREGVLTL